MRQREQIVAEIAQRATETFGDVGKARRWLTRPTRALSGLSPMDLIETENDVRRVKSLLSRIDHGLAG